MRRVYFLIKKSSYTYYRNNFFLDRRNKYFKYSHRRLIYNSKSLFNRYSSIKKNINLRKHNINKTNRIWIYFSRWDLSRRKLNKSFTIETKSVLNYLRKNAINIKIYLYYWKSIEKTNDSTKNLIYL